ncbi:MAG: SGNH/GDSL hydrolase family protein [Saprospiraceae bacterium]|nr:SGNH/GDSL hydrolase family protein [Saprospiraceae bacterium]
MNRRFFLLTTTAFSGLLPVYNLFSSKEEQKLLPRVLILGDSISIGYTPYVRDMLDGIAEVHRPTLEDGTPENCEGTSKGVLELDRWLGAEKWDVIHFNFGLHDIKHVNPETGENSMNPKDPQQASVKKYRKNLVEIVEKLKVNGAYLIFATTTPYPNPLDGPLRKPGEPQKYNEEALKIMKKYGVHINDLYSFVKPQMEVLMRKSNVHFTEDGSEALAKEVVNSIKVEVMKNP